MIKKIVIMNNKGKIRLMNEINLIKISSIIIIGIMLALSIHFTNNSEISNKNSVDNNQKNFTIQSDNYGSDIDHDSRITDIGFIDAEYVWSGQNSGKKVNDTRPAGQGIRVAVIDSGVDLDHPDLIQNLGTGYNVKNANNQPNDGYGHGTHCAGIIAASPRGHINGRIGVAPLATIIPVKVYHDTGSNGFGSTSTRTLAGIQWCIDQNNDTDSENDIDIISISMQGSGAAFDTKVENARKFGIIIVTSIGNSGQTVTELQKSEHVISVGNLDTTGATPIMNPTSNEHSAIDFVAPGTDIVSTWCNGSYGTNTGTSMAVPMVAGTIALLLSANRNLADDISNLTLCPKMEDTVIYKMLKDSAIELGEDDFNITRGWGHIDAYGAYKKVNNLLYAEDPDVDNDKLYVGLEEYYGTSDDDTDFDNDGYTDFEEVNVGSDPTDANFTPESFPYSEEFDDNEGWGHNNDSMITINNDLLNITTDRKRQDDYSYKRIMEVPYEFELKFRYNPLDREAFSQTYVGLTSFVDGTYDKHFDGLFFHHYGGSTSTNSQIKFDLEAKVDGTTITSSNYYLANANNWYIVYMRKTGEQVSMIIADANDQTIYYSSQTLNASDIAPLRYLFVGGTFTNDTRIGDSCLDSIELRTNRDDLLADYFVNDADLWTHADNETIEVNGGELSIHTDCSTTDDYSYRPLNLSQNFELRFTYTRDITGNTYSQIFIGFTKMITDGSGTHPAGTYDDLTDGVFFRFYYYLNYLFDHTQSLHLYSKVDSTENYDDDELFLSDSDDFTFQIVLQKLNTNVSMQIWDEDETEILSEQNVIVTNLPQLDCLYVGGEYTGEDDEAWGTMDNINVTDLFYDHYDDFSDDVWTHAGSYIEIDTTNEQMNITTKRSTRFDYSFLPLPIPDNFELVFHYTPLSSHIYSDLYIGVSGVNSTGQPEGTRDVLTEAIFFHQYGGPTGGDPYFHLNTIVNGSGSTTTAYEYDDNDEYKVSIIKNGSSATLSIWDVDSSNLVYNATLNVTNIGDLGCLYVGGRYTGSTREGYGILYDVQFRELPLHSGTASTPPETEPKFTNLYSTPLAVVLGILILTDLCVILVRFKNLKRMSILPSKSF